MFLNPLVFTLGHQGGGMGPQVVVPIISVTVPMLAGHPPNPLTLARWGRFLAPLGMTWVCVRNDRGLCWG